MMLTMWLQKAPLPRSPLQVGELQLNVYMHEEYAGSYTQQAKTLFLEAILSCVVVRRNISLFAKVLRQNLSSGLGHL